MCCGCSYPPREEPIPEDEFYTQCLSPDQCVNCTF